MQTNEAFIKFTDIVLNLNYKCNFNCNSCLLGDRKTWNNNIPDKDACQIIDSIVTTLSPKSIGFVGGEPFLSLPSIYEISRHIGSCHQIPISISTNASWAQSLQKTIETIEPLSKNGLKRLLVSWDDFHSEYVKLENIAYVVTAAQKFNIEITIQNIIIKNSTRNSKLKKMLSKCCDIKNIRWIENPCTPVGEAVKIQKNRMKRLPTLKLSYGNCNAGKVFNIQPDGTVQPCCGAGLLAQGLTIGNVFTHDIHKIVSKASVNLLLNCLIAYRGPMKLFQLLIDKKLDTELPSKVTDVCELCFLIFSSNRLINKLEEELFVHSDSLILSRLASELFENENLPSNTYSNEQG